MSRRLDHAFNKINLYPNGIGIIWRQSHTDTLEMGTMVFETTSMMISKQNLVLFHCHVTISAPSILTAVLKYALTV